MKIVISSEYQHLSDFLHSLPRLFQEDQGHCIYKQRNEVRRFEHQGVVLIVKRYKKVNVIQQVVYSFFRKTKAHRAYLFAQEFRQRGIETPREVAYLETTNALGLFTVGYLVTLWAEGTETSLLLREVEKYDLQLADEVAAQIVRMHSRGVLHGDLNLSNFLCRKATDGHHFTMIDINRSHFRNGMPADDECLANLVRITHRRDLYEYLIRSYARQRGWDADDTASKGLQLLDRFEQRKFHL